MTTFRGSTLSYFIGDVRPKTSERYFGGRSDNRGLGDLFGDDEGGPAAAEQHAGGVLEPEHGREAGGGVPLQERGGEASVVEVDVPGFDGLQSKTGGFEQAF